MIKITKATKNDAILLSELSIKSFLPPHSHSSPKKDILEYISKNFSVENYKNELSKHRDNYYLCFFGSVITGYSKILFNESCPDIKFKNISYLSRIYFLEDFYGKGFAQELLKFNINLCIKNKQKGMWLKVWIKNERAINFYKKMGFTKVGKSDFKVSETHSNPNYHMYLDFKS